MQHSSVKDLFYHYYPRLCHFAWQLLDNKEMVEDIVQDAFMAYWDNKDIVADDEVAVKNFLYAAVRHACYNAVRHEKVVERYLIRHQGALTEEAEVLGKLIRSEVIDEIYKIIQALPSGCREVFRLGYLEGLTNPQIAKHLDISINTVKTQKQRGLKIIRGKLNPELYVLLVVLGL